MEAIELFPSHWDASSTVEVQSTTLHGSSSHCFKKLFLSLYETSQKQSLKQSSCPVCVMLKAIKAFCCKSPWIHNCMQYLY